MKIELNKQFKKAFHLMEETNSNLFITGKAGTGKSTLLDYFCINTLKDAVVLAPTGVAALNVKGQTIHRFFNFYIDVTPEKIRSKEIQPRRKKIYKKLKTIIIDEVSMLRADLLDCIDVFLQIYGPKKGEKFGGIQMIFVGDLYQLPPVVGNDEREIFRTYYETPYFFSSKALEDFAFEIIELEKIYRQKEQKFIDILNKIRNNSVDDKDIEDLNKRYQKDEKVENQFAISLTTTNKKADEINEAHLQELDTELFSHTANISGNFTKEYFPTATTLQFKIGAQIMLLNNDQKNRWVNGSIGIIESKRYNYDEGKEYYNIRLHDNDRLVSVYPFTWEVYRFALEDNEITSESVGSFEQYPFRLAWAVTIHKSQGKTFDKVIIDIGKGTFASGQIYVALSRCTSFAGVSLKTPIQKKHIRTDYRIYKFLTSYSYKKAEEEFSIEKKTELIKQAIKNDNKLEITYLRENDTKLTRMVTPLTVGSEEYKGVRYPGMRAFCEEIKEKRMFHLGRILHLRKI